MDRSPSSSLFGRKRARSSSDRARNVQHKFPHADIPVFPEFDSSVPDTDESDMVPRYDQLSPVRSHRSPRLRSDLEFVIYDVPNSPFQSDPEVDLTRLPCMNPEGRDLGSAYGMSEFYTILSPRTFPGQHLQGNEDDPMEGVKDPILYEKQEEGEMAGAQGTIALEMPLSSMEFDDGALIRSNSLLNFLTRSIEFEEDDMLKILAGFLGGEMATNSFYEQCRQLEQAGKCHGIDSFQYNNSSELQVVAKTRNDLKMLSMLLLKLAEPSIGFENLVKYISDAYRELILEWETSKSCKSDEIFQNRFSVQSLRKSARTMYDTIDSWCPNFNPTEFRTFTHLRGSEAPQAALISHGIALFACQRHEEHINRAKNDTEISLLEAVRPDKVAMLAQRLAVFPN